MWKLIIVFIIIIPLSVFGFSIDKKLLNEAQEMRAVRLFKIVKCLVCSGESLYESNSYFALEMRKFIRDKISAGANDKEIILELRKYYGDQVINSFFINGYMYWLWVIPIVVIVIGVFVTAKNIKIYN